MGRDWWKRLAPRGLIRGQRPDVDHVGTLPAARKPPAVEGIESFVTFRHLGGPRVTKDEIIAEIRRWPVDAFLGYLAAISLEGFQKGPEFINPGHQGHFLNLAIVDEFPTTLARASEMYKPGQIPITGGLHILVHEQNMAWLSHAAMLHADRSRPATDLSYEFKRRTCRLLLLINDLIPSGTRPLRQSTPLRERKQLVASWLRMYQFNRFIGGANEAHFRLARQKIIMADLLPRYYPIEEQFAAAAGVPLHRYFQILSLFLAHLDQGMSPERRWLTRDGLCSQIRAQRDEVERLLFGAWSQTPDNYAADVAAWQRSSAAGALLPSFDYVPLRSRPLIEARPGEFVCPVVDFLGGKIEDGAYYMMADYLSDNEAEQSAFFQSLGRAFEEYASGLVSILSTRDRGGPWTAFTSPTYRGREITDDYLQRNGRSVCFEHKAGRPPSEFLRGGDANRVIGPDDAILERLEARQPVTTVEGRKSDKGYLTRGLWQLRQAADLLPGFAEAHCGETPATNFPIVTHLSGIGVDEVVYRAYLEPLMQAAGLIPESRWEYPQWIHIADLEWLAALAENGELDLYELLRRKAEPANRAVRFDIFLHRTGMLTRTSPRLREEALQLMENARATFFPDPHA